MLPLCVTVPTPSLPSNGNDFNVFLHHWEGAVFWLSTVAQQVILKLSGLQSSLLSLRFLWVDWSQLGTSHFWSPCGYQQRAAGAGVIWRLDRDGCPRWLPCGCSDASEAVVQHSCCGFSRSLGSLILKGGFPKLGVRRALGRCCKSS